MTELAVRDFGQIAEAKVAFGDLTLIIGPQASGKSIFLQLFKLLNDNVEIVRNLKKQGFNWHNDQDKFLDSYFGENMHFLRKKKTMIHLNGKIASLRSGEIALNETESGEHVFYIPAQRVMVLDDGWPRPFSGFRIGDPYVVKDFSERLRLLMETGLGKDKNPIFPHNRSLKQALSSRLDASIFKGAAVELDSSQLRNRLVLRVDDVTLPYMTWSTGQREFMPLLLGLDRFLTTATTIKKKSDVDWVIVEEPEMGLHPRAILSLTLILLDLIARGYKLIISTHSPVIPETVWALQMVKELNGGIEALYKLFDIEKSKSTDWIFKKALAKTYKTHYFDWQPDGIHSRDISSLNPGDEAEGVADWGGLTEFSSNASEVISKLVQERE